MTNNTNTTARTITCDFPETAHPGFPCAHPVPTAQELADLNRAFQKAKNDLIEALGKVEDDEIEALADAANGLRWELADKMAQARKANGH